MVWPASASAVHNPDTGVKKDTLIEVGKASVEVPSGFVSKYVPSVHVPLTGLQMMHDRLKRHTGARIKSLESGSGINWGTAEV